MPDTVKSKSKPNSTTTALVIGGAGFVGSYVCESLLAQNVKVLAIDDLSSGKEEYIENLKKDKSFQFIKLDIDQTPLPEFPDVKYIFHIGGIESYINGNDLSLKTMLVNSIGTYNILELTRKNNAKLLLASSLDIYGGVLSSLSMKNYFGQSEREAQKYTHHEAKRYAEALVTEYYRKFEIDARIIRVADVYGPRMDLTSGTEIATLFQEAITADILTVHGDGLKVIHPTFVSDVVAGITKAMFTQGTQGKIYNITSHDEINVLNFAYTVQKNSTKPLKIQFTQEYKEIKFPLHPAEIQQTESDLAWNAKTKLPEGVTQTLEYFFLKQPAQKPLKKSIKATPQFEQPDQPQRLMLENMTSKEVKPLPSSPEATKATSAKPVQKTAEIKEPVKFNKVSAIILASSLFIVLTLFIFPLFALFTSNDKSINSTSEAVSQETIQAAANAQKNIYYGNVQYDNLEWFFNTVQKRDAFENTRTSLQALDKLNIAIASQAKLRSDAVLTVSTLTQGKATVSQIETIRQQITSSFLNIQNAVIENESAKNKMDDAAGEILISAQSTSKLIDIMSRSEPLLKKYEKQASLIQNVIQFLSPAQNKTYLVLLQDTLVPNKNDAKVIGYAYVQLNKSGITTFKTQSYQYKSDKTAINDVVKDILEVNKNNGWLPLNAIFTANTKVLQDLVTAQGSVTSSSLAQIVSGNDVQQKLIENRANPDFQFNIWKESLASLANTSDEKLAKIGEALYQGIAHEDIKMVIQDSKNILSMPACDIDRILQRDFVNTDDSIYPNKNVGIPYCLSLQEKQLSVQTSKDTQKEITVIAEPNSDDTSHFKLSYKIKNNSKTAFSEDVDLTLPGAPQLTNLQFVFPLSLDKARAEKRDTTTGYTINLVVEPGSEKELVLEWNAKNTEGNLNKDGLYIAKPYGSLIEKVSATITKEKEVSKTEQNADLYLK